MNEDILDQLKDCIVDALGVRKEEIQLDSQIINDLGADSLDLVEITYLIETRFNISVERGAIMKRIQAILPAERFFNEKGYVSDEGKNVIRQELPELAETQFPDKLNFNEIALFFTVETFLKLVNRAIETQHLIES